MDVIAIIPARGNSKRIKGKNIASVSGKPLIAWTIESALASRLVERVIVSTDDPHIGDIALAHGAEVPFLRPREIAQDDSTDFAVYKHATAWYSVETGQLPYMVAWLRPTSPLRTPNDIDASIEILERTGAACVRSVTQVRHHPYWMKTLIDGQLHPFLPDKTEAIYYQSQMLPKLYYLNGVIDVVRCDRVNSAGSLFPEPAAAYETPVDRSIDIDDHFDLELAVIALSGRGRRTDGPPPICS